MNNQSSNPVNINETYPELVEDWGEVVDIELRGVMNLKADDPEKEGTCCELDDENPQWYSVYARHAEGWSTCVSDHYDLVLAIEFLVHLQVTYPHLRCGRLSYQRRY